MTQTITYDGATALEGVIRRETINVTEIAHLGETGSGSLTIDDPSGAYTIAGLKSLVIDQSAATPTRLFSGSVTDHDQQRGAVVAHIAAAREIVVHAVDLNELFNRRVVSGDDGDRPAETVGERMTWLLASGYLPLADTGWVVYPDTDMSASDYRGQFGGNVVSDCAIAVGFNYFARWDSDSSSAGLFFDNPNTSTLLSSSSRISNVAADFDGVTTHAPMDEPVAVLTTSPEGVYSGMYVPYLRGGVYRTLASTAAAFAERDGVAPSASVEDEASAIALGDRLLLEASSEDDSITCSIMVWPANVNDIQAGDRIEAKFSHFAGYEDFTWMRVKQRSVTQPSNTDARYRIDLVLSPAAAGVPSQAVIFFSNDDNGYSGDATTVSWRKSGDSDPGDITSDPLVGTSAALSGSLAYVVGAATPPFATGGGWWNGIECLAAGTLDVYFATTIGDTTHCSAPITAHWQILINGAMVAETTQTSPTVGCFADLIAWGPTGSVSATIDVNTGDIITARVSNIPAPDGGRVIPLGVGANSDCLVVSGTLYPLVP